MLERKISNIPPSSVSHRRKWELKLNGTTA